MIDGCRNGQIGTIKTYTRRGIQIDTEMLSPTVPLIGTGIIAPGLSIVEQGAVGEVAGKVGQLKLTGVLRAAYRDDRFIHQVLIMKLR
ncbi:hypothetical protein D3C78_1707820 [compost metagenome]